MNKEEQFIKNNSKLLAKLTDKFSDQELLYLQHYIMGELLQRENLTTEKAI